MFRQPISVLLLVALVVMPVCALLQKDPKNDEPYALIFGTVLGPDSRPIQGVTIKIRSTDKKKPRWEHTSDRRGEFARRVPPGPADYVVWADLKDKQAAENTAVTVHIAGDERHDIILHLNQQQTSKKK
jgi:hypothetical protein